MIEAIREIGGKILENDSERLLDNLILDLPSETKGRKPHLIIIDYKIFDKAIDIDFEEIKDDTTQKYLWVGNADAANSPQIYFTTNNISYLISQTIPNLIQKLSGISKLKNLLVLTQKEIFYGLGFPGRCKYILDGEKTRFFEKGYIKEFLERKQSQAEGDIFKELLKELESKVSDFINLRTGLTKKDISIYTLKINGELMVGEEDYRKIVIREKIESLFEDSKERNCSCCNKNESVTDRPKFAKAKSALGYYITDKVGFSSGLSGEFLKNFCICKDCYKKLLVGEVFVRNNLSSFLAGSNLYIIPKFIFPVMINQKNLSKWAEYIQSTFNSAKSLEGLRVFQEKIKEYKDFEDTKNNFTLNLLFWRKGTGAETKVLRLIKDVPPTRLDTLRRTTNEVKDIGDRLLGDSSQWIINLQSIYYLIPLRKTQNAIEYRKILSLYDAIFSEKPVSYSFLINEFIELAQVYRFEKFDAYNIGRQENPDIGLVYAIIKANLLLLYLRKLNLLDKGGEDMDYNNLQLEKEVRNFLKEMKYDEPKVSMFLLGYLIGEIGNAQYVKGKSKPILGKITFQGMNKGKLIRLLNEVFEKLIEYKKLSFNEQVFAECKKLLDQEINSWPLSDQENVFYVLSGYAFATHEAIKKASAQKEEIKQTKEEVKENE